MPPSPAEHRPSCPRVSLMPAPRIGQPRCGSLALAIVAPVSADHDVCYDNVAITPMWRGTARCDPAPATALTAPKSQFANPRSQSGLAARRDQIDAWRSGGRALRPATPGRIRGPQIAAARALQVHDPGMVAQQILPVVPAVTGSVALGAVPAVVAARARQPGAPAAVGIGINRQHDSSPGPEVLPR
jgi:hypothetical protein